MALVQGKRLCCRTDLFTCWYHPAQSAHVCHQSEIQPIQWQMDRHYHLFPAHRYQGASHPAACTPKLVHLADATWIITSVKIQCRQWLMSQTRWCLVHWRLYTKISLRHRAGLWEWYPASKKMPISRPVGRFNQWDLSESNPIHPFSWSTTLMSNESIHSKLHEMCSQGNKAIQTTSWNWAVCFEVIHSQYNQFWSQ